MSWHVEIGFRDDVMVDYGPSGENAVMAISLDAGGPFQIGTANITLVDNASTFTITDKMEVWVYEKSGSNVSYRWFGGHVCGRTTSRIKGSDVKLIDITAQDYNIHLDTLVGRAADAFSVDLTGGVDFDNQVSQLWLQLTSGASAAIDYVSGVANLITSNTMPAQSFKGMSGRAMMQEVCNAAQTLDTDLRPRFYMGVDPIDTGTDFLGPYLYVYDGAIAPSPVFHFTDESNPIGTGSYKGILDYNRDLDGTRLTNKREIIREQNSTVLNAEDATSHDIYLNPFSSDGYWWDVPLTTSAATAAEAQAEIDRSVAATANPRETIDIEVLERVRPGETVTLTWALDGIANEDKRVVAVTIEFFNKRDTSDVRLTLSLNARRLEYFEDGDEGVDAPPTERDIVPPNAPTSVAVNSGFYDPTVNMARHTVTWTASTSPDCAGYFIFPVQGPFYAPPTRVPDGDTDTADITLFAGVPYSLTMRAFDGHNNLSEETSAVTGTAAEPDPSPTLYNPGFETRSGYDLTLPDGWLVTLAGGATVQLSTTNPHSGVRRVELDCTSGMGGTSASIKSRFIQARASTRHKIAAWVKGAFAGNVLTMKVHWYDAALALISTTTLVSNGAITTAWNQYAFTEVAPTNTHAMKVEIAHLVGGSSAIMHVDDVECLVNPPTLGFYNGSFEISTPNPIIPDGWLISGDATGILSDASVRDGVLAYKITQTPAQTLNTQSTPMLVQPDEHYTVKYSFRRDAATVDGTTFNLLWRDATGGAISTTTVSTEFGASLANYIDRVFGPFTSPSTAASVILEIVSDVTPGTTVNSYVDAVDVKAELTGGVIRLLEGTAPSTPGSGFGYLYLKATDGRFYTKDDAGTERVMGAGSVTNVTGTAPISVATGTTTPAITHDTSGVSAAKYSLPSSVTVNATGHITAATNGAGTSFPGSPSSGDTFFRTDLGVLCSYDGTRWLGPPIGVRISPATTYTATTTVGEQVAPSAHNYWLASVDWWGSVATTNDATKYWTLRLGHLNNGYGGVPDLDVNTSAKAADAKWAITGTIGAAVDFSNGNNMDFFFEVRKDNGAPGTLTLKGASVTVHRIYT